jgi:hypothetical protein
MRVQYSKIPVPVNDVKLQGRNSGAVTNRNTSCEGDFKVNMK